MVTRVCVAWIFLILPSFQRRLHHQPASSSFYNPNCPLAQSPVGPLFKLTTQLWRTRNKNPRNRDRHRKNDQIIRRDTSFSSSRLVHKFDLRNWSIFSCFCEIILGILGCVSFFISITKPKKILAASIWNWWQKEKNNFWIFRDRTANVGRAKERFANNDLTPIVYLNVLAAWSDRVEWNVIYFDLFLWLLLLLRDEMTVADQIVDQDYMEKEKKNGEKRIKEKEKSSYRYIISISFFLFFLSCFFLSSVCFARSFVYLYVTRIDLVIL